MPSAQRILTGVLVSFAAVQTLHVSGHLRTSHWLNVTVIDNVTVERNVLRGLVNSRSMVVFAVSFNATKNVRNFKVKLRGNLGKPSPTPELPLVATVRNSAGGDTFTVPYQVWSKNGSLVATEDHATRYMCPVTVGSEDVTVATVSTGFWSSPGQGYHFEIQFEPIGHWMLELNASSSLILSPSDPAIFEFSWPNRPISVTSIVVNVTSIRGLCKQVAIQHKTCPLASTPAIMTVDSQVSMVTTAGFIAVRKANFPDGFYVAIVTLENEGPCGGSYGPKTGSRQDTVWITAQLPPVGASLRAIPVITGVALVLLAILTRFCTRNDLQPEAAGADDNNDGRRGSVSDDANTDEEILFISVPSASNPFTQMNHSSHVLALFSVVLAFAVANIRSRLVEQELSGVRDLCYYNHLCMDSLILFSSSGRFFSSLPYLGASVGLAITAGLQQRVYRIVTNNGVAKVAVDHDFSLVFATALALFFQSILRVTDAQCPNPNNLHLHVMFIYLVISLISCKLFSTRRKRTLAGHYVPLLLIIWIVTASYVKNWWGNERTVWTVLAVVYLMSVFFIGLQIYVLGEIKLHLNVFKDIYRRSGAVPLSPNFKINRSFFIITMLANVCLAIVGVWTTPSNFSTMELLFCTTHVVLHTIYYLLQKVLYKERLGRYATALLLSGLVLMLTAIIVSQLDSPVNTEAPPAVSRSFNQPCLADSEFDRQDLFHMLMAPALFCMANGLLLLDDDVLLRPRSEIAYF